MHGRLKVRTTAEQQEAKRKEREEKLKIYQGASKKAFEKREKKEYDNEALEVTGSILAANPDFYTLWNFRREILTHIKENWEPEDLLKTFNGELFFIEQCLRVNPKSYGSWQHRCWVMDNHPKADWSRELSLCNKFLEYDERNFHCWDYRRFVVKRSSIPADKEFDFTTEKISSNFSNFSSWHYRSKLLPILLKDSSQKEEVMLQEFELVQNAFFTDPSDQSAWFYHLWLLGKGESPFGIKTALLSRRLIAVSFNHQIRIGNDSFRVMLNDSDITDKLVWRSPKHPYSYVWFSHLPSDLCHPDESATFVIDYDAEKTDSKCFFILPSDQESVAWRADSSSANIFAEATTSTLTQELETCEQLHELEPDNKWTLLTIVWLMEVLDPSHYHSDVLKYISKLMEVDPMRRQYYLDMRSKCIVGNAIRHLDCKSHEINLSHLELTCVPQTHLLVTMTMVNLSNNSLVSLPDCSHLLCVQKLDLSNNSLKKCSFIQNLPFLQELSLKDNSISSVEALQSLASCPKLSKLVLSGNPVCLKEESLLELKRMLPNVHIDL